MIGITKTKINYTARQNYRIISKLVFFSQNLFPVTTFRTVKY
jgi:hypothetical protein